MAATREPALVWVENQKMRPILSRPSGILVTSRGHPNTGSVGPPRDGD